METLRKYINSDPQHRRTNISRDSFYLPVGSWYKEKITEDCSRDPDHYEPTWPLLFVIIGIEQRKWKRHNKIDKKLI